MIPQFSLRSLLLLTAGVGLAASLARTIQSPDVQYRAECAIELELCRHLGAMEESLGDASLNGLTSPDVLRAVVQRREIAAAAEFRGQQDAAENLAQQLEVRPAGEANHCHLAYQSSDANVAAEVVDAVIEEYARVHNCRVTRQGMLIRVIAL